VTSRKQSENEETNKEKVYMDMVEESDEKKKAIKKALKKLTNIKDNPNFQITDMNSSMVRGIRDTIQEIWESVNSLKCPHCGIKPSNIKLDSYTKFIIETKSDKEKIGKVLHTKKGYESDEEETEEDREKEKERREFEKMTGIKSKEVQQIYINPLEVKEHVRILWANHGKILNLIFGNLVVNQNTLEKLRKGYKILCNGHEMFFLEVVPVTPNRFRPENKMNGNFNDDCLISRPNVLT
jgi:DNA-directed RNA polymerase I subunit RPA1